MALKHCMLWLRPSRLLGFFFFAQLGLLLALMWWVKFGSEWLVLGYPSPNIRLPNWLILGGIEAAVAGWVVTSFMTARNSIKQHTITTLLQSRLSATYMAEANVINKNLFPPSLQNLQPLPLEFFHDEKNADTVRAVNYLINYFEFLSVAMRHGDLDAKVVRDTLRGILLNFYNRVELYIKYQRGEDEYGVNQPNHVEHYIWLVTKWKKQKAKEEKKLKKSRELTLAKRKAAGADLPKKPSPLGAVKVKEPEVQPTPVVDSKDDSIDLTSGVVGIIATKLTQGDVRAFGIVGAFIGYLIGNEFSKRSKRRESKN